jgi:hypothetical protein
MKTIKDATKAVEILRQFIGDSQLQCLAQGCRSEEKQYFIDKLCEMVAVVESMPKTYDQDGLGDKAVAYLHYFTSGCDWWITEKDKETADSPGQHQAFGLASLNGDDPELGYISIVELLESGAELDLHWTPKTLAEIKEPSGHAPELDPPLAAAAKLGRAALVEAAANAVALAAPSFLPSWRKIAL